MSRYVGISLDKFYPDKALPCEVYLFISGNFIKYKNTQDEIPCAKYNEFLFKKIRYLFIDESSTLVFDQWAQELEKEFLAGPKIEDEDQTNLAKKHLSIRQNMMSLLLAQEDQFGKEIGKLKDEIQTLVESISRRPVAAIALAKMARFEPSLVDHGLAVANLSVFLGQQLGYNHQLILENLFMGALLHDYGKLDLLGQIQENPSEEEKLALYKKHPQNGSQRLSEGGRLPEEVIHIIEGHHEHHDGSGFPQGLKGARIYELSKLVAIANFFVDTVTNSKDLERTVKIKKAIDSVMEEKGKMFDPQKCEKCVRALELLLK